MLHNKVFTRTNRRSWITPCLYNTCATSAWRRDALYIKAHLDELLADYGAVGELFADEALKQLYDPFLSLKLAELLISFGEITQNVYSHALGLKAKGDALVQISHYQAARECLDASGEEFLALEDEMNWARSRISWMIASAWLGHVEEAIEHAARAREVFLRRGELLLGLCD